MEDTIRDSVLRSFNQQPETGGQGQVPVDMDRRIFEQAVIYPAQRGRYVAGKAHEGTQAAAMCAFVVAANAMTLALIATKSYVLTQTVTWLGGYEQFSASRFAAACVTEFSTHILWNAIRCSSLPMHGPCSKFNIAEGVMVLGKGVFLAAIPGYCSADNPVSGVAKLFIAYKLADVNCGLNNRITYLSLPLQRRLSNYMGSSPWVYRFAKHTGGRLYATCARVRLACASCARAWR